MMALVSPSKEFQSHSVSWAKENSTSLPSKRYRSESLPPPPQIVKNGQLDRLSQQLHVEDIVPINDKTNEAQQSILSRHSNNGPKPKRISQSFTLMRTIDEKEKIDQQDQNNPLPNTTITHIRRFPLPDVVRIKENLPQPSSKPIHSESLPGLTVPVEQIDAASESRHIENTTVNELPQSASNFNPENARASRGSSGSFCSLKIVDEKEQKEQLTKTTRSKRGSITSPDGKKQPKTISGTGANSSMANFYNGDATLNENRRLISSSHTGSVHTTTYNYQSTDSTTTINGKPEENNRRKIILFNWQNSYCYKALGCLFAMAACSIGIAALIFALLSYRNTIPAPTFTTTSSTSSTSTTSSSTTTTTTSSLTTTSTTTDSTTSSTSQSTSTTSTSATTFCSTTKMTTVITVASLPSQCMSYINISDTTRRASYSGSMELCDQNLFANATWVRFIGGSGISLANCPVAVDNCGGNVTGWYSGIYPARAGALTEGTVCFNWSKSTCYWQTNIQITNCNGYYIYQVLPPPTCIARYCTM